MTDAKLVTGCASPPRSGIVRALRFGLAGTRRRVSGGVLLSFGDQGLVSACNFLATALIARALGLEAFGYFSLVWVAIMFTSSLQLGVIVSPMMSIGPQHSGESADAYYGVVGAHHLIYLALSAFVVYVAVDALMPAGSPVGLAGPAAITGVCYLAQDFLRRYLFTRHRPQVVLGIDLLNQAGKIGAIAWLGRTGSLTVAEAMWIVAGSTAVSALSALPFAGPIRWRPDIFAGATLRQWRSARWLVPTAIVYWLLGYSGLLVTGGLLGVKALGALRAAQSILGALHVGREALDNFVPPRAARALAESGVAGLRDILVRTAILGLLAGGLVVLVLALFGDHALTLIYGAAFEEYGWVVKWSSVAFPISLLSLTLMYAFRALETTSPVFVATALGATFNVALMYPMALFFDVAGVIAVQVLTECVICVALATSLRRSLPDDRRVEPSRAAPAAPAGLA